MVLAVAVGAGIALAACGGDSSPETPIVVPTATSTTGSLGKTEFIAQADSACAEANASIEQFAAAGQGESEAAQIAQLRQGVIDTIKQLKPPSDTNLDAFLKRHVRRGLRRPEDRPRRPARRGPEPVRDPARQRQVRRRAGRLRLRLQAVRRGHQLLQHQLEQQLQFQQFQLEQWRHGSPSRHPAPPPPAAPAAAAPAAAAPPAAPGRAARAVAGPPEALAAPAVSARVSQAGGYAAASSAQVP